MKPLTFLIVLAVLLASPREALAFCGFYVSGADAKLFNNATQVVLMREGTRTVLSMQNNYQGPTEDFSMVVPVPVVLQKDNVKTLPREIFEHVDTLAAPRLVEYWEQDPCAPPRRLVIITANKIEIAEKPKSAAALGVKIEAKFAVGEYEILILSANNSVGLDTWLRQEKYKIPEGAAPILRPYVQAGMKFFVAKVDASKVRFEKGMAMLSPLRFHYDSETFNLPIRLGLLNSGGAQDLIVHLLARGKRFEAANYKNVFIPTNIDVAESARGSFASFYAALFDRTLAREPGSIVTEYSWDAGTCDPCPMPALSMNELTTLGFDVLPDVSGPPKAAKIKPGGNLRFPSGFVLTRLHARYTKESLGEDLVFREAAPVAGGREVRDGEGKLETGAKPSSVNNFQGRYAIRHPWTQPIECKEPRRGNWGGPPDHSMAKGVAPALNLAFAPRGGIDLAAMVMQPVPDLGLTPAPPAPAPAASESAAPSAVAAPSSSAPPPTPTATPRELGATHGTGCGSCALGEQAGGLGALSAAALAGVALFIRRRRQAASPP